MNEYLSLNLSLATSEIFVLIMACIALLAELFGGKNRHNYALGAVIVALIGGFILTAMLYSKPDSYAFFGMFVHDKIANLLKLLIYITSFFSLLYARHYIRERKMQESEYYVLALFSVLGMMVLVAGNNLLILFLGLELLSLPLYALIALRRDSGVAGEAAMKYYAMGAMASAILLYGMSLLYGVTNGLDLQAIAHANLHASSTEEYIYFLSLILIVVGVAFKLGAAPFHIWAPDVYQGAPTPVTLFISSAPKIAAIGLAIRLFVDSMPHLAVQWQELLILVSLISMGLGNVVAIVQTNIKRMLAYSSIAHMGYASLGLLTGMAGGYAATIFYIIIYAIMAMGAFAVVVLLSRQGIEAEAISDYRGLNSRSPWLAFMMLLLIFSMAGIPPTAGFFAKLGVLDALVSAHFVWLAVVAIIFAVIGSYYYLAIVKVMYFEEPVNPKPVEYSASLRMAISVNALAVLFLGLFPTKLIDLCRGAFM